jgi:glycosyltransferase involved in cell wall biosynthesis
MLQSHVLLLLISREQGPAMITAKLFEYLGARRTILAVVPGGSDAAEIVRQTRSGVVVEPDDVPGIARAIGELYERWRRGLLSSPLDPQDVARYDGAVVTRQMARVFDWALTRLPKHDPCGGQDVRRCAPTRLPKHDACGGKVKILYLIPQLGNGGAERQMFELITRLDRSSWEPLVVSYHSGGEYAERLRRKAVRVIVRPKVFKFSPAFLAFLVRTIRRERVSLIHAWLRGANEWARLAGLVARVPVICSIRIVTPKRNAVEVLVDRALRRFASRVISNTRMAAGLAVKRREVPSERMLVIPNGVDMGAFLPPAPLLRIREELGLPVGVPLIASVGSLIPRKDHPTLLRAAVRVLARRPDAKFLWVGDGPLLGPLRRLARELGVDRAAAFVGERDDIPRVMNAIDLLVLSSAQEGMPNVILEAMAAGRPVVATDVGGCREAVVHGRTGLLVPRGTRGNPEELANAILSILSDPDLAAGMGRAGRERVQTVFTPEKMASRTMAVYRDVLVARSSRAGGLFCGASECTSKATLPEAADRPLKVLMLMPATSSSQGGDYFWSLAKHISAAGVRLTPVSSPGDLRNRDWPSLWRDALIPDLDNPSPSRAFGAVRALARLIVREHPQVIHVHGFYYLALARAAVVRARMRWSRPRVILTFHNIAGHARWKYAVAAGLLSAAADRVISVSVTEARVLRRTGLCRRPLVHIPNAVDISRFDTLAATESLPAEIRHFLDRPGPLIGCVARLTWEKGLAYLLRAVGILIQERPHLRLIVVGGGPLRRQLSALAEELGLSEKSLFTGPLNNHLVPAILSRLDVFVLPSVAEALPLSLLESMAAGLPSVVTAVGDMPRVVADRVTGLVVPPRNADVLADAIDYLLARPKIRAAFGKSARRRAKERYSLDRVVSQVIAVYEKLPGREITRPALCRPGHRVAGRNVNGC